MQRDSDSIVLKAIKENNLIFISAQPDSPYFHWQVALYLYQFAKHGIIDNCYALFGYTGYEPSEFVKKLSQKYPNVKYYKDGRKNNDYSPAIRPHLMAKFFKEYPELGKNVFYHDSDIFLTKLPRFDLMLNDKIGYLSDTISYIGFEYIKICSNRYKDVHKNLNDLDIFNGMCKVIEIDPEFVKVNDKNSGGAQYLLKDLDVKYWKECEVKCEELYQYLCDYEKRHPIPHHIQKWTTDMWVVLWTYWKQGKKTVVHKELDFSWATGTINDYDRLNIFHLAGITPALSNDKFYKGKYNKRTVFDAYYKDPTIFNHINKNNATARYVDVIKEYMENVYIPEINNNKLLKNHKSSKIDSKKSIKINNDNDKSNQINNNNSNPINNNNSKQINNNNTNQINNNNSNKINNNSNLIKNNANQICNHKPNQMCYHKLNGNNNQKSNQISNLRSNQINATFQLSNTVDKIKYFKITKNGTSDYINDTYIKDESKLCCNKPIWRSKNGDIIIFWNNVSWIMTYANYENIIGPNAGGLHSTISEQPYQNKWNTNLIIDLM
jgi:hypothetical protein